MNKFSVQYDSQRYTDQQNGAIRDALNFAVQKHNTQLRASGEPYIIHPVAVAELVASWGLDHEAVMAALLHDVVEDTDATLDDLTEQFGPKVAELVDGVTKLRLSASPRPAPDSTRLEVSNENLRKLLLATAKDYRVILIKLADRLHNMRTLEYLPEGKRVAIARESIEIYARLADRLGMGQLKGELEDLGFKYSKPAEYAKLVKLVKTTTSKAQRYLSVLKRSIETYLTSEGVEVLDIEGRQKHYYSIYKKLVKVDGDIEKIYDLMAVRVVVPDVVQCYQALGILHQHYKPLIYRIKDYVAVPKTNGYQSLHTTVFAEAGHITEIQIRTPQMHEAAEYGLAAHFFYDAQKSSKGYANRSGADALPNNLKWVNQLAEIQRSSGSAPEFVEGVKLDLFANRIFAFSPLGDLYDLPEGSTPVDFAFAIHSDLGLRTLGAKVNGRMVTLDYKLENRDVVEILSRREAAPNRDWLGFVATNQAKGRIRAWFRAASRDNNIASGRAALESELKTWDIKKIDDLPKRAIPDLVNALHLRSEDDLLAQVGEGALSVSQVIKRLIPDAAKPKGESIVKREESTGRVMVEGDDLPYSMAPCCSPIFPQPLIGYVTRGKGVTVHALGCRNVPTDVERYATCRWETMDATFERLVCRVEVRAVNHIGLVSDITGTIAAARLNIAGIETKEGNAPGETLVILGVEVPDLFVLASMVRKLSRLSGILGVRRVH
jgi:guanosine-3',5'-bis(diphosphate) 3'-pyrophosphohydrolase